MGREKTGKGAKNLMKIQCPYYELSLDDYSSPSCCSFAKPFHGRLSDIQSLIDALTLDNPKGIHDELIAAFAAFQKGDHNVSLEQLQES